MYRIPARRAACAIAIACFISALTAPAFAGVNFTSGKVYVQQKVWDKAAHFLEMARKEEPENVQVYSLLGLARAESKQYASAGAAFAIGIDLAQKKKDEKRQKELENNRGSYTARLYNTGVKVMSAAGSITADANRTTGDETSAQGKVEKEKGAPKDFSRFTEGGQVHEFWYYPEAGVAYHFSPGMSEPIQIPYKPFAPPAAPEAAITDTTTFGAFQGSSRLEEAAYDFQLALLVDPTAADAYKNLSYLYELLGRTDDAIAAARLGLKLKPDDPQLGRNLRVAAMGRANRLFAAKAFREAADAYRTAMQNDSSGKIFYISQMANSWLGLAETMDKADASRPAALDSAATKFKYLLSEVPAESTTIRENAYYNMAVIYGNMQNVKKATETLDEAVKAFPKSKDLLLLAGQTKFQAGDISGAVTFLRQAVALDPKDPVAHQFLFLSLAKQTTKEAKDQSVAEYTIYKALSDGKSRTGAALKTWVDSAVNRVGKNNQLTATLGKEGGYPDEVRTFTDGDKLVESWFYWSKGKAITFMDGQFFSQSTFPPVKS